MQTRTVTSAGARVDKLKRAGVRRLSLVTTYIRQLTDLAVDDIRHEGVSVADSVASGDPGQR